MKELIIATGTIKVLAASDAGGTILALLGLGVLIGIAILMQKGKHAAAKALNKHVLFREEYSEGQNLVTKPLTMQINASAETVMAALDEYVATSATHDSLKAVVYESARGSNGINYAYGNKLVSKTFEAAVRLKPDGQKTVATFKILTWHESSGMISGQDMMKKLYKQVKEAFEAASVDTAYDNVPKEDSVQQNWKCECGEINDGSNIFCGNCGKEKQ